MAELKPGLVCSPLAQAALAVLWMMLLSPHVSPTEDLVDFDFWSSFESAPWKVHSPWNLNQAVKELLNYDSRAVGRVGPGKPLTRHSWLA